MEIDKKKVAIGAVAVIGVAALCGTAYYMGFKANDVKVSKKLLDIAHEVSNGGAKCIEATHTSGAKLNMLFFGDKGLPEETIRYLMDFKRTV